MNISHCCTKLKKDYLTLGIRGGEMAHRPQQQSGRAAVMESSSRLLCLLTQVVGGDKQVILSGLPRLTITHLHLKHSSPPVNTARG